MSYSNIFLSKKDFEIKFILNENGFSDLNQYYLWKCEQIFKLNFPYKFFERISIAKKLLEKNILVYPLVGPIAQVENHIISVWDYVVNEDLSNFETSIIYMYDAQYINYVYDTSKIRIRGYSPENEKLKELIKIKGQIFRNA